MKLPATTPPRSVGIVIGALGLLIVVRWFFAIEWIDVLVPGAGGVAINTGILFFAAGICCFGLADSKRQSTLVSKLVTVCAGLLIALPVLILLEHIFDWQLGLDFVRTGTQATPNMAHPGRIAPNTCVGFLAGGCSFLWMQRGPKPLSTLPLTALNGLLTAVAIAGFLGHLLRVESLYRLSNLNSMLPATAIGLTVLSAALWLLREQYLVDDDRSMEKHESRITRRSVAVLALVAISAGISGFVVLRDTFEKSVADGVLLIATTNGTSLTNTIDVALWFPRTVATRPAVWESLEKLGRNPHDDDAKRFLGSVADSFLTAGLTSVEFFDISGNLLVAAGTVTGSTALSTDALKTEGQIAQLRWRDGYILYTENQVVHGGRVVGQVKTEQRLPIFDRLLENIRHNSESSDALLCSRVGNNASCAVTRFNPKPFLIPMFKANGDVNLPINHALVGESGVVVTPDLRDVEVVAAYVPIKPYGLGLVVKTDVNTLYAPLRDRVQLLVLVLVGLVFVGNAALRMRVRPLLGEIVREQRRTKVILDNSNDAFIAMDRNGKIKDWNVQAEKTFGWPASVAIGHNLADLIIPENQREAHRKGLAAFYVTGQGPVVNRRIEVMALHRLGHEIPIELAVAALWEGDSYVSNAFARDISERKAHEHVVVKLFRTHQ